MRYFIFQFVGLDDISKYSVEKGVRNDEMLITNCSIVAVFAVVKLNFRRIINFRKQKPVFITGVKCERRRGKSSTGHTAYYQLIEKYSGIN